MELAAQLLRPAPVTFEDYRDSADMIHRHPWCPRKPGIIQEALEDIRTANLTEEQRAELRAILCPDDKRSSQGPLLGAEDR